MSQRGKHLLFFDRMNEIPFKFNNISQSIKAMSDNKRSAIEPGVKLDASLRDLSAIAGVTGDKLKEIKGYARSAAKTFCVDAVSSAESHKLILSQLSPELGKYPEALRPMGDNIAILLNLR